MVQNKVDQMHCQYINAFLIDNHIVVCSHSTSDKDPGNFYIVHCFLYPWLQSSEGREHFILFCCHNARKWL